MRVYLAGQAPWIEYGIYDEAIEKYKPLILDSYYYIWKGSPALKYMHKYGDFFLDSGAFSFLDRGVTVDWEKYTVEFGRFCRQHNVEHFFEMDIDAIVGYEEVLRLRGILENEAGRQSIPVWHDTRGTDEFIKSCEEYPYVAIGGLVNNTKVFTSKVRKYFPWFIENAHKRGAKIHALGFTSIPDLYKYHFDSVDSSSWTTGNRYGFLWKFNGRTLDKIDRPQGTRIVVPQAVAKYNFTEWCKFQKYAEVHL